MWSSNSSDHPAHYDTFARTGTGSPFQVNAMGTEGQSGGLNGLTSQAIYQQANGDASDLFLFNLSTKTRTNPPSTINTNLWEWSPSISAGFILFGRNNFKEPTSAWKVMLFNRTTGVFKVLDSVQNKCECIFPGQVTDQYATWTRCSSTLCQSWYYTIATGATAKIPNPQSKQTYYPAVAATSGNMFFARSDTGCGNNTKIYRWKPSVGGNPVLVSSIPTGYDLTTSSLASHGSDGHDDVYIDRLICSGQFNADIYMIDNADTATSATVSRDAGRTSGVAKHLTPPGATPS
jgi:hypothetical protein